MLSSLVFERNLVLRFVVSPIVALIGRHYKIALKCETGLTRGLVCLVIEESHVGESNCFYQRMRRQANIELGPMSFLPECSLRASCIIERQTEMKGFSGPFL